MKCSAPVDDILDVEVAGEGQCKHYHPGLLKKIQQPCIDLSVLWFCVETFFYLDVNVRGLFCSVFVPVQSQPHAYSPPNYVLGIILPMMGIMVTITMICPNIVIIKIIMITCEKATEPSQEGRVKKAMVMLETR